MLTHFDMISTSLQGNLSNQRFVIIYDPIRDSVREALERRYSGCERFPDCESA
jgi:hypothetical protein